VTVDRATDTVLARATFPNPSGSLINGQRTGVLALASIANDLNKLVKPG
jgi:hypothetical protein